MHFHAKNLTPQKCVIFNIVYARYKSINALDKSTCDAKKKQIDSISNCYDVWGKHKSSLVVEIVQINHKFSWNTIFHECTLRLKFCSCHCLHCAVVRLQWNKSDKFSPFIFIDLASITRKRNHSLVIKRFPFIF